jgi:hypothetical protein
MFKEIKAERLGPGTDRDKKQEHKGEWLMTRLACCRSTSMLATKCDKVSWRRLAISFKPFQNAGGLALAAFSWQSAAVRQRSMADITFNWSRLT